MSQSRCWRCAKTPGEILEYREAAQQESIARARCVAQGKEPWWYSDEDQPGTPSVVTPQQYVEENEGTYNAFSHFFYCTDCYIAVGMPLGIAP